MTVKAVIPTVRYTDALSVIDWLCDTWGFKRHLVVDGPNGTISHAELMVGESMIMVASTQNPGKYNKLMTEPRLIDGKCTQAPYLVVDDPDWYYERAKNAGATILIDIKDEEYGGRDFTCADLEGHIWSFGSFNPFPSAGPARAPRDYYELHIPNY